MKSSRSNTASKTSSNKEAPGLYSIYTMKSKELKSGNFIVGENNRRIRDPITLEFIPTQRAVILNHLGQISTRDTPIEDVVYDINGLYTWFIEKDKNKIPHSGNTITNKDAIKDLYYSLPENRDKVLELRLKAFWEKYNAHYINTPFPKFLQEYKSILESDDEKSRRNFAHNLLGYTLKNLMIQHGFI